MLSRKILHILKLGKTLVYIYIHVLVENTIVMGLCATVIMSTRVSV